MVTVQVRGNADQAIKTLKQKMQHELIFNKMKREAAYESPSEAKKRKGQEKRRRCQKNMYRRHNDD